MTAGTFLVRPAIAAERQKDTAEKVATAGQPGTEPEIVVEVRAMNQEGFDDATVRNVSENAGALKFDHREFGGRVVASRHRGVAALPS